MDIKRERNQFDIIVTPWPSVLVFVSLEYTAAFCARCTHTTARKNDNSKMHGNKNKFVKQQLKEVEKLNFMSERGRATEKAPLMQPTHTHIAHICI